MQSIELVEFYLEPPLTRLEPFFDRISILNTEFWDILAGIRTFGTQGRVRFGHQPAQSIELVEIYPKLRLV